MAGAFDDLFLEGFDANEKLSAVYLYVVVVVMRMDP
jgi:hypothetical protein